MEPQALSERYSLSQCRRRRLEPVRDSQEDDDSAPFFLPLQWAEEPPDGHNQGLPSPASCPDQKFPPPAPPSEKGICRRAHEFRGTIELVPKKCVPLVARTHRV